jgi:hypothetical protein
MPASIYSMAGKPHHAEVSTTVNDEVVPEPKSPQVSEEPVIESSPSANVISSVVQETSGSSLTQETIESSHQETAEVSYPAWDPSWTKAQLLEVAAQLELNVTLINTKTEIIAALTAATSN